MRRKVLLILGAVVLLGVAAWAIWGLGSSIQERNEQDEIYQRLRTMVKAPDAADEVTDLGTEENSKKPGSTAQPDDAEEKEPDQEEEPSPETESEALVHVFTLIQEENPECVAWVSIEGTDIDYPVMYSPDDPDYYLDHSFEKTQNRHGVPFLDSRCNIETGDNLIVYGHHFVEGTMFSSLHKYADYSFYEDHPVITLETADGVSQYRIAAVLRTSGTVTSVRWSIFNSIYMDEQAFDEMVTGIHSQSLYNTGVTPGYGDHLITLATCEYTQKNGRLAVVAVKEQ